MNRICLPLIVLATFAWSLALHGQTRPAIRFLTYRSEPLGFQIQYISTWTALPGDKPWIAVTFVPTAVPERLSRAAVGIPAVMPPRPGQSISLEDIAAGMVEELKLDVPDAKITIAIASKLGGENAWRMILTGHNKQAIPMRLLVVAAAHNNTPYVVGIVAPDDEWDRSRDGFDKLIETFTFIEKKP